MAEAPGRIVWSNVPLLQGQVSALLLVALAYRQAQVAFDIPPVGAEVLALIAVLLWAAFGLQRRWQTEGRAAVWLEWSLGGGVVAVLLAPHVPVVAVVVALAAVILSVCLAWLGAVPHEMRLTQRLVLILAVLSLSGFALGGQWDWAALVCLVLAAGLLAVQVGRQLLDWSRGGRQAK